MPLVPITKSLVAAFNENLYLAPQRDCWAWDGPMNGACPVFPWPAREGGHVSVSALRAGLALRAGVRFVKNGRPWRTVCGHPDCVKPSHAVPPEGHRHAPDRWGITPAEVLDLYLLDRVPVGLSKALATAIREGRSHAWITGARCHSTPPTSR